ncbi:MAG: phosphopyruvate hydratase, partial [Desulfobulbaceae bacterium]|nr:phosphopyruvate hydratase [Desulfobulbaceae bacterium]
MSEIIKITARQILDSRGNPTVEADVLTSIGNIGRASVPSGASTGTREALELRDGDKNYYLGKSVRQAITNINERIAPLLMGKNAGDQNNIDGLMLELDGSENKENLGANAILAVSMAACRAAALDAGRPLYQHLHNNLKIPNQTGTLRLPTPMMNIINGGEHASNNLDIQEFMIVPHLQASFAENLRAGVEIFHHLKKVLAAKNFSTNVGDEGGFAPNLGSHEEAIELILTAIEKAGYQPEAQISLALDAASSEFYRDGRYEMRGKSYSAEGMIDYYAKLVEKYPIYSIEDGLAEADFSGWTRLTEALGDRILDVGDDLFVTNKKILQTGIDHHQANAILVKVNQIG